MSTSRPAKYWAIEADFSWGPALIGIGFFGWQRPEWCGATVATFETRAMARKYRLKISGMKARPVRVELRKAAP